MKEYQSDGDIVASLNDSKRTTPAKRIAKTAASPSVAVAVAAPLSKGGRAASDAFVDNLNFAFRTESHQSLLTTSSLSLSHSSFDYWPEFQQNYHSIMDNTNLLDSCAAALSDITYDDDDSSGGSSSAHRRNILCDRSLLSSAASSSSVSFCGTNTSKSISPADVERFSRWLCEMEKRVADQPTLSQIFAMSTIEMAVQLKVHSKLFNDIVAQPCIVNGSKRKEHKLMEERYHLLYLKAYEVQLLLEGLPGDNHVDTRTSANKILNKSFYDLDEFNHVTDDDERDEPTMENEDDFNCVERTSMDNGDTNGKQSLCEHTSGDDKNRMFTRSNRRTDNVGTYYFKYEQTTTCDQQLSQPPQTQQPNVVHDSVDETDNGTTMNTALLPIETEISFATLYDNEIRSYLNDSDTVYSIGSNEFVVDAIDKSKSSTLQPHFGEETMRFSQDTRLWNDLDFSPATHHKSVIDQFASDTESHSKVRNWLYNRTDSVKFMSSLSLDRISGDDDIRMLYRSRSELNLGSRRKSTRSLRSSSNGLASLDLKGSDSVSSVAGCSLDWDFYQNVYGSQQQADEDTYFDDNDFDANEMTTMANNLCDFGNDYSLYLTSSTISLNTDVETNAEPHSKSICDEKTTGDSATTAELVVDEEELKRQKRIRRHRKKRAKKRQRQQRSVDDSNSEASSEPASTEHSSIASSDSFDSFVEKSNEKETSTPSAPSKTIKYDSSANKFEVYSDGLAEPRQLKVSELRPEDFHDVIAKCQNNIDCVITVLGAKPNQVLTVAYCRRMRFERSKSELDSTSPKCQCIAEVEHSKKEKQSSSTRKGCQCNDDGQQQSTCICLWVEQTIAMILNFLMDCWNIFRNMKLYTYLCRVLKGLFGSTRYVADHLKLKSELTKLNALKYS